MRKGVHSVSTWRFEQFQLPTRLANNWRKKLSEKELSITPSTKVAALLDRYPELEDVLIGIAPPFKKLKNPIIRRSVAKVASLRQVAAVGRVPVDELVNELRAAVGQEKIAVEDTTGGTASYFTSQPDWFDPTKVVAIIDEREPGAGDPDRMAITRVLPAATRLQQTEILELITTFLPAPGIDVMQGKGFLAWSVQEEPELIRTYFTRPTPE
jgi:hypothetical protein